MSATVASSAASAVQPAFAPGQRVRVRQVDPPGHIRTPHYIRGRSGVVERFCGYFPNPEEKAYGRSGEPLRALYRVRFVQSQIWDGYTGGALDTVDIDLYEHWLEPARA